MFHLIKIYKRSRKATLVSILGVVLSIVLILVPIVITVLVKRINPLLFLLFAVCFGLAAMIISERDHVANQIAEHDILNSHAQ